MPRSRRSRGRRTPSTSASLHTSAGAGTGFWLITRYEDARTILEDWETFSSVEGSPTPTPVRLGPVDCDPPHQTTLRALINPVLFRAFSLRFEDEMRQVARELIAAASTDRTARVEGDYVLGVTQFWRGEFATSERHLVAAVDRYSIEDAPLHVERYAQDPLGVCLSRLALTQLFRGRPGDADATMREAVRVAIELDNPMTVGYVRAFEAILAALEPELVCFGHGPPLRDPSELQRFIAALPVD